MINFPIIYWFDIKNHFPVCLKTLPNTCPRFSCISYNTFGTVTSNNLEICPFILEISATYLSVLFLKTKNLILYDWWFNIDFWVFLSNQIDCVKWAFCGTASWLTVNLWWSRTERIPFFFLWFLGALSVLLVSDFACVQMQKATCRYLFGYVLPGVEDRFLDYFWCSLCFLVLVWCAVCLYIISHFWIIAFSMDNTWHSCYPTAIVA